jgi:hypothetical protein
MRCRLSNPTITTGPGKWPRRRNSTNPATQRKYSWGSLCPGIYPVDPARLLKRLRHCTIVNHSHGCSPLLMRFPSLRPHVNRISRRDKRSSASLGGPGAVGPAAPQTTLLYACPRRLSTDYAWMKQPVRLRPSGAKGHQASQRSLAGGLPYPIPRLLRRCSATGRPVSEWLAVTAKGKCR